MLLIAVAVQLNAQPLIHFKISRPLSILAFLKTASGSGDMSRTLATYIGDNTAGEDKVKFSKIIDNYRSLGLDYSYTIPGYPESRPRPRTTMDLLIIAAVQARDEADFMQRIIGLLPNETWLQLGAVMKDASPFYDRMLGRPYAAAMNAQLGQLQKYNTRLDGIFSKLSHFYGSTWSKDIPFTVAIYPVPGKRGNTTATPHSNSLVLAVLTEEKNYDIRVSVAVHEICHVLYGEQPMDLQLAMDKWFAANKNPNAVYAGNYIDEALATACGNGWAYKELSGKEDTTPWYDNEYINAFAHAIYPMVKEYISANRQLGSAFVQRAITLFSNRFPAAYKNYQNLMNKVNIYTDAETQQDFGNINGVIRKYYRVTSSYGSYPIAESMQQLEQATGTQFFLVYKDHTANYKLLYDKFPELKKYTPQQEGVISFFDKDKRAVIIVNVKNKSRIDAGMMRMAKAKEMNETQVFVSIE